MAVILMSEVAPPEWEHPSKSGFDPYGESIHIEGDPTETTLSTETLPECVGPLQAAIEAEGGRIEV